VSEGATIYDLSVDEPGSSTRDEGLFFLLFRLRVEKSDGTSFKASGVCMGNRKIYGFAAL
jgi:hypothetical protein